MTEIMPLGAKARQQVKKKKHKRGKKTQEGEKKTSIQDALGDHAEFPAALPKTTSCSKKYLHISMTRV